MRLAPRSRLELRSEVFSMLTEARFPYALRFTLRVPLVRKSADPSDAALDHYLVELLHVDEDGEEELTARASVYRIRRFDAEDVLGAADEIGYTELLEQVCAEALDRRGSPHEHLSEALGELSGDPLVLDKIEFLQPHHDEPMLRVLIARGILDTLGRGMELLFLPNAAHEVPIWERAMGAIRLSGFTVVSAAVELPDFPAPGALRDCN
jgi:hypothetical protein